MLEELQGIYYILKVFLHSPNPFFNSTVIPQKKRKDFVSNLTVWKGQADVKLAVMELGVTRKSEGM